MLARSEEVLARSEEVLARALERPRSLLTAVIISLCGPHCLSDGVQMEFRWSSDVCLDLGAGPEPQTFRDPVSSSSSSPGSDCTELCLHADMYICAITTRVCGH